LTFFAPSITPSVQVVRMPCRFTFQPYLGESLCETQKHKIHLIANALIMRMKLVTTLITV